MPQWRSSRIALGLGAVVVTMLALSFAAVPFYGWFCRVTGYGGATAIAEAPDAPPRPETVTVRFDGNTGPDMPWEFRPVQRTIQLRLGETGLAFFTAHNPSDRPVAGTASFNVAPYAAGPYFAKIACFCFERQILGPGERVEMPVSFFVDPEILRDAEAKGITEITLSYTMYRSELPKPPGAPGQDAAALATAIDATIEN